MSAYLARVYFFISTILDDYSRFIIEWDLRSHMKSEDVKPSVDNALNFAGLSKDNAPRLLSDNAKCYLSKEIKDFFEAKGIKPINGKPCHPQTQEKIERYHRTMKNVIRLDNYYSPEDLRRAISEFVKYYNYERYHESLGNLTPADVYYGRDREIIRQRNKIKKKTLIKRRKNYIIERLKLTYKNI